MYYNHWCILECSYNRASGWICGPWYAKNKGKKLSSYCFSFIRTFEVVWIWSLLLRLSPHCKRKHDLLSEPLFLLNKGTNKKESRDHESSIYFEKVKIAYYASLEWYCNCNIGLFIFVSHKVIDLSTFCFIDTLSLFA